VSPDVCKSDLVIEQAAHGLQPSHAFTQARSHGPRLVLPENNSHVLTSLCPRTCTVGSTSSSSSSSSGSTHSLLFLCGMPVLQSCCWGPSRQMRLSPVYQHPSTLSPLLLLLPSTAPNACDCCLQLDELLGSIRSAESQPRVGHLPKEQPTGPLAEMWLATLSGSGLTLADAAPGAWAVWERGG
jgi:hypothetical protein